MPRLLRARHRVFIGLLLAALPVATALAHPPAGFVLETYASGLNRPLDLEWAPNGLLFVAEKSGTIAVVDNGVVEPAPFINIREQVNRAADRGLLGIAVHPDFPATPYLYILHVYDPPETAGLTGNAGPDGNGQRVSRLIRVTADAASGYKTAVPGSEVVLLGAASTWANIGDPTAEQTDIAADFSCGPAGAYVADCLPADGLSHSVGTVAFGPDGMLYVGNGDASTWTTVNPGSLRALDLDSLAGKILRIDPATGKGLADNPYWDGDPDSNRSRVLYLGLRNPYRFRVNPDDGKVWIADVGWEEWEELNQAPPGADFGWPCYEGGFGGILQQPGYAATSSCQAYYAADNAVGPVYSYPHRSGFGGSIIAGEFYRGSKWPAQYQGTLMLSDYSFQELSIATISGGTVTVTPFADDVLSVDLAVGPDGDIYSANVATGDIERIRYEGGGGGGGGGTATQVAGFLDDFTGPSPAPGWSYSWNANGPLGDPAVELPLLWSAGRYDSDGVAGQPDATAMYYGFVGPGSMHPGRGQANGEADDRFAIARYTVSQAGNYRLENGLIAQGGCEFTNGVELAILVDQTEVHRHLVTADAPDVIDEDLGYLAAGTSIAVAVGPNGNDGCDQVQIDWQLSFTPGDPDVGNAPVVTIDAPLAGQTWRVGDVVSVQGSATDAEDGPLAGDALQWDGIIIHNTHQHPDFFFASGAASSFDYPDHGDNSYVELCLEATDSDNRQGQACVEARPELASYTFISDPPGLTLTYNGESGVTPFSVDIPVGGERLVAAPWMQGNRVFSGWSIGGQASQQLIIGDVDLDLVATYVDLPGPVEQALSASSASGDDAEEDSTGAVSIGDADLDITTGADIQLVGLRFPGLAIEPGAVIADAYIQFTVSQESSDPTTLEIRVQDSDDAAAFLAQPGNVSARARSTAVIGWSPTAWLTQGDATVAQRTPNLAELLTGIVNRPGWQSGNAVAFLVSGDGRRVARGFDHPDGGAPTLVVSFANQPGGGGGSNPPPANNAGGGGGGGSLGWLGLAGLAGLAVRRRRWRLVGGVHTGES